MTSAEWIPEITDRIVRQFDPVRIILFGSQARGTAHSDSDIDLLVVMPDGEDRRETAIAIRRVLGDLPVAKDVIVTTPAELARRGHLIGSVLYPALREGAVIYDRS